MEKAWYIEHSRMYRQRNQPPSHFRVYRRKYLVVRLNVSTPSVLAIF